MISYPNSIVKNFCYPPHPPLSAAPTLLHRESAELVRYIIWCIDTTGDRRSLVLHRDQCRKNNESEKSFDPVRRSHDDWCVCTGRGQAGSTAQNFNKHEAVRGEVWGRRGRTDEYWLFQMQVYSSETLEASLCLTASNQAACSGTIAEHEL